MEEETAHVPSASPLTKSGGRIKRSESPRSSTSGGKVVPHYLRASTGSCHEICKHGKQEERVSGAKDSRPWRKPVTVNGREDSGVTAIIKKTVVVKPKSSADHKITSSSSRDTMGPELSTTTEKIDMPSEHTSSLSTTTTVTGEPISDGPEITLLSVEKRVKQDIAMASENVTAAAEGAPSDVKDSKDSKKSSASPQGKPSLRSPSPFSPGSSVGRSVDGRKSMEGRKSLDGRKAFEGRKSIDGRKNVEGRNTIDERKGFDVSRSVVTETTQKCDGNEDNAENNSEGSMSADKMKSIEGSKSSLEKKGSEGSKSLKLKSNKKEDSLGNAMTNGKSELLKKLVAVPKPMIAKTKPSPSLNPTAVKPPSPLHPSSGTRTKTIDENQVATKRSTSKLEMKKVDTPTTICPSSRPSVNGEEITNMKKVRVIRVVSSIRRQRKITKVASKDSDDQGLKEDTAVACKITPTKKLMVNANEEVSSDSLLPLALSVSKSTVRSRISYATSRPKNSPAESGQKIAIKEASASGLRKSKAVDLPSENHRPNTLKSGRVALKKRISAGGNAIEKSNSGRSLSRRPSARQKKNVQVLFNKVIEETASRLVRTSKSKVLALVGAFETVISIQRKSSAVGTRPKSKKISSSSKTSD